jgi:lipoate---protein ligase
MLWVLMPLKPYTAEENEEMTIIKYIRKGMAELPVRIQMGGALKPLTHILQSWDWAYGQTPEFTYSIKTTFGWGNMVSLTLPILHIT